MLLHGLSALLASLGFAVLFNIRGDKLISASLIGAIGGLTYYLVLEFDSSQTLALFIASVVISVLSEVFARLLKCPVTTFLICALIPLVPGGGMYNTMLEVVKNNLDGALKVGVDTIIQACSIVIGCMMVSSCLRMFNRFSRSRKNIVK